MRILAATDDAEIIMSQPGIGPLLGPRVLGEFGDDPERYATEARKNYAATSPITRASGKKKVVAARFVHNDRLVDALNSQAFSALQASPGACAYYDQQRDRGLVTVPPCGSWRTGSSASCPGASRTTPAMTKRPPGSHQTEKPAA